MHNYFLKVAKSISQGQCSKLLVLSSKSHVVTKEGTTEVLFCRTFSAVCNLKLKINFKLQTDC